MITRLHRETWLSRPPRATVAPALMPWLTDPSSLTARVKSRCNEFGVELLGQALGRALRDEAVLLGLRAGEHVWVREVLLIADGRPVVFARSLLPACNVRGAWNLFQGFGARPLGAALFSDPAITRAPLACTRLDARDARYHRAYSLLSTQAPPVSPVRALWGRRSLFYRHGRALMVSEFFLPAIFDLPQ